MGLAQFVSGVGEMTIYETTTMHKPAYLPPLAALIFT
jgi:hypothetical protein